MTGGICQRLIRLAGAVAVGLVLCGLTLGPAAAADLGGDCCADLEERVAELEATTVRKGNRKVSVEISGHVNRMVMYWDDSVNDDVYLVDNSQSESQFRLTGSAGIMPGLSAGFLIEAEAVSADSDEVNARIDGAGNENIDGRVLNRRTSFHLKHNQLGKVTLGREAPATRYLITLNLAKNPIADARPKWGGNFHLVRPQGSSGCTGAACRTSLDMDVLSPNLNTTRGDIVRYDSPSLFGLVISASWGEDDLADVAVRYKKEWNSIRLVAGVGYLWFTDETEVPTGRASLFRTNVITCPSPGLGQATCVDERQDFEDLKGSASMMHVPTGLYLYGAFVHRDPGRSISSPLRANTYTAPVTDQDAEDATMWYLQAGIKRRLLAPSLGATTLYGEYQQFDDFGVRIDGASITGFAGGTSEITDTSAEIWGLGVVQDIDAAAMKLYAALRYWENDVRVATVPSAPAGQDVPLEDFVAVALGGKISF